MNQKPDGAGRDEVSVAARIKAHMSGLDQYIPVPPPFESIEGRLRPGAADWGRGRRLTSERRDGRLRRSFGTLLAAAAIVMATALVLGPRLWLAPTGPAVTGRTAPAATATATTRASLETPPPTPTSAAPTATPSAAGSVHQKTILDSGTESVGAATWSPGGTNIAVTLGNSGQSWHVRILRSDGTPIETVDAWELAWIDDTTYVALNNAGKAFVGHVGSSARSDLPGTYPCGLLGGSPGVVALMTDATCTNATTRYVIWTPKGLSAPRSGVPVAISPDGTLLAVVHDPTECCGGGPTPDPSASPPPKATLDIVRTSTGVSVARAGNVAWAYGTTVIFSPDAKRVAYLVRMPERPSGDGFAILDVASGTVSVLDGDLGKVLGWMANDRLLVASRAPGAPAPKGLQVTALDTVADTVALSSTGRVAAALAGDQATQSLTLTLELGAERETLELPAYARVLVWSTDGSTLLAVCSDSSMHPPDQVVLVQP